MKRTIAICLVALMLIACFGCAAQTPAPTPSPDPTLEPTVEPTAEATAEPTQAPDAGGKKTLGKMTYEVPDTWLASTTDTSALYATIAGEAFMIAYQQIPGVTGQLSDAQIDAVLEGSLEGSKSSIEEFQEVASDRVEIGGAPGVMLRYTGQSSGQDAEGVMYALLQGDTLYVLSFAAPGQLTNELLATIDAIMQSIAFEKDA